MVWSRHVKELYKFYFTGRQPYGTDFLEFVGKYSPNKEHCIKSINGCMIMNMRLDKNRPNNIVLFTDGKIWA